MTKPDLLSFSDFLMIDTKYDQRSFFAPEIEYYKNGIEALLQSGLISQDEEKNRLIEYKDNIAILRIEGPMRPGKDWWFSVGYGDIQEAIIELIDSDVSTVIQLLDTPGGTVKQAFETEEMFYELSKEKNLVSLINMATSAGALMTFPAKERYLASKTAQTGSIGVVAEHIDNRTWYKEFWGAIRTSVAKGEMKDAGTDTRGFDAKAKEVFTEQVDKLYNIFADSATKGLGISRQAIDEMQSRVFIGQDGIDKGFAQGFATLNQLIDRFNVSKTFFTTPGRPAFHNILTEENRMDKKELKAKYPDVYEAILEDGRRDAIEALKDEYIAEGKASGILAERNRITEIEALCMPKEFTAKAKKEDWSPGKAAAEYLKAEAMKRQEIANKMETEVSDPLESDTPVDAKAPEAQEPDAKTKFEAKVSHFVGGGMKRTEAIKAAAKADPELHQSYINSLKGGSK